MEDQLDSAQIEAIKAWLQTGALNFFGRPFSGKDTQGKHFAQLLGAPLIGGGDILRTGHGYEQVKAIIDGGRLAPTKDFLHIILPFLNQEQFHNRPLVLNSVGRWHGEETSVIEAANQAGHPLKAVIYLAIDDGDVRHRWLAAKTIGDRDKRADDASDVLEIRLTEFRNKTQPVIDFYRQAGLLIEVDGSLAPDQVTAEILAQLQARATRQP